MLYNRNLVSGVGFKIILSYTQRLLTVLIMSFKNICLVLSLIQISVGVNVICPYGSLQCRFL